eukprot:TRINITY_DN19405_c0_g1_i1.p1 TRINITY_DN19405_c0_g1~~TRINITY_DN19405_c0_g1_i1.p1  ORF type:complete len:954 (-),score=151.27 TRINITY_DN19405_c0_g1_i1:118-2979(-)
MATNGGGYLTGVVLQWVEAAGLGLIRPDGCQDGSLDVFVRRPTLAGHTLTEGQPVMFETTWRPEDGRYEATSVHPMVRSEGVSAAESAVVGQASSMAAPVPMTAAPMPAMPQADTSMFVSPNPAATSAPMHFGTMQTSPLAINDLLGAPVPSAADPAWSVGTTAQPAVQPVDAMLQQLQQATLGATTPGYDTSIGFAGQVDFGASMPATVSPTPVDTSGFGSLQDQWASMSAFASSPVAPSPAAGMNTSGLSLSNFSQLFQQAGSAAPMEVNSAAQPSMQLGAGGAALAAALLPQAKLGTSVPSPGSANPANAAQTIGALARLLGQAQAPNVQPANALLGALGALAGSPSGASAPSLADVLAAACGGGARSGAASGAMTNGPPVGEVCDNMFVGGLPLDIDDAKLRSIFNTYGTVVRCRVLGSNGPGGEGRDRAALVQMATSSQARWLVENLNHKIPPGLSAPIMVRYATYRNSSGPQRPGAASGLSGAGNAYGPMPKMFSGSGIRRHEPYGGTVVADPAALGLEVRLATHSNSAGSKIWVGSIPTGATQDQIRSEFVKFGDITDVYTRDDGRVPGRMWGFVTFSDPNSAVRAVTAYQHGLVQTPTWVSKPGSLPLQAASAPQGHPVLQVKLAQRGDGSSGKLWVGSIPEGTTHEMLTAEFGRFGQVQDVFLKNDGQRGGLMWGFVTLADAQQASNAVVGLNGQHMTAKPVSALTAGALSPSPAAAPAATASAPPRNGANAATLNILSELAKSLAAASATIASKAGGGNGAAKLGSGNSGVGGGNSGGGAVTPITLSAAPQGSQLGEAANVFAAPVSLAPESAAPTNASGAALSANMHAGVAVVASSAAASDAQSMDAASVTPESAGSLASTAGVAPEVSPAAMVTAVSEQPRASEGALPVAVVDAAGARAFAQETPVAAGSTPAALAPSSVTSIDVPMGGGENADVPNALAA